MRTTDDFIPFNTYQIDWHRADFLEEADQIREGIHLVHFSGKVPIDEFHKAVWNMYPELQHKIEQESIAALGRVEVTTDGIIYN